VKATDLTAGGGVALLDVTDRQACASAFAGADAVVHLAAVPDPDACWDALLPANVVGTQVVAQAAMDAGVRRLVLASSLQAVSAVPTGTQVRADDPPRPANLYGATKAWAEAVGSWVAATSPTTVVALRIGYFQVERPDRGTTSARNQAAWLSSHDAADLIRAAVEANVRGFVVANGVSANRHRQADLEQRFRRSGTDPSTTPGPDRRTSSPIDLVPAHPRLAAPAAMRAGSAGVAHGAGGTGSVDAAGVARASTRREIG
jgi:uronate dehydrogenase